VTPTDLLTLIRWGLANDREAALIPLFMLAAPMVAGLFLEGVM
jgi:hypothetical protein